MSSQISPSLKPVLRDLEKRLRDRFGQRLSEIRLFGSYARGEAHEDSDVDVLVLIDKLLPTEIADVATAACMVTLESKFALSPLAMSTQKFAELESSERLLAETLNQEGITL